MMFEKSHFSQDGVSAESRPFQDGIFMDILIFDIPESSRYVKFRSFCTFFWWKGTNVTYLEDPGIGIKFLILSLQLKKVLHFHCFRTKKLSQKAPQFDMFYYKHPQNPAITPSHFITSPTKPAIFYLQKTIFIKLPTPLQHVSSDRQTHPHWCSRPTSPPGSDAWDSSMPLGGWAPRMGT